MSASFNELKKNLKKDVSLLKSIKIALLGDTATQFLAIAIRGIGIERGYNIDLFEADFNQIERQFLDPTSEINTLDFEFIVVCQSTHKLLSNFNLKEKESQNNLADERLKFIKLICNSVDSKIIYFNYPVIDDCVFGSYANNVQSSFTYQTRKINFELMNLSQQFSNLFVCDIAALQNKFGRNFMFDTSVYVNADMVFSIDAIPYIASRTMDIICAIQGRFKKCLILDLDNTMWGGIIGDDGIENIQLGTLGIGKAFTEFQYWIKKLKNRGIIIAICSKNEEIIAKEPFKNHPDMVLRLEDISIFVANWDNKVDNIREIQQILKIGFDSMVFLDDNPFERNMVKANLPEVCVPDLPEDPAEYLEYLYSLNLFETVSFSAEDTERTKLYQVETERNEVKKKFTNEDDFLMTLNMLSFVEKFNSFNTPRVAQLSQRSNQFNLRTIRYTEAEIEKISTSKNYFSLAFSLEDKYGDHGLICVVILKKQDSETLFIESWFMSCRVLKRGMEIFVLNTIISLAKENDFKVIAGEYIPTIKNKLVENHFIDLGFVQKNSIDKNLYEFDIENSYIKENYITKK